jgi:hypothetical protein
MVSDAQQAWRIVPSLPFPGWLCLAVLWLSVGAVSADTSTPSTRKYIRVVQEDGIWWFEDGDGRKFFSLGVNCIGGCFGHAEDTPLSPTRKHEIETSLRDWGFNTAGAWSSPTLWDGRYVADQIYPPFHETHDDVFDPSLWDDRLTEALRREVEPFLRRKYFVGYFLDNEREWEPQGVFEFYLRLPPGRPGSRAFATFLERYYQGDVHRLNTEWGTAHTSFADIVAMPPPATYPRSMQWGLLQAWRVEVATAYYRRYAAIIRALDPDHLILGVRYRGLPDRDLCVALSPYFDVNSINDYNRYGYLKAAYAQLYEATGKPLMISEFSFSGFSQPGRLSDLFVDVYRQEYRGRGYRKYVQEAAQAPFMVGMHWFMWRDYPADEAAQVYPYPPDQNVGLVSGDDRRTYAELTDAVSQTNAVVEAIHRHARRPPSSAPLPQSWALRRFVPVLDGNLAEWPEELTIRPTTVRALPDHHGREPHYFVSWDEHALYLAADITSASQLAPPPERAWQGDYLALQLSPMTSPPPSSAEATTILIYPTGGGADQQQPLATRQETPEHYRTLALQAVKRTKPGAYTLEVRIPIEALEGFREAPGSVWRLTLQSQHVSEIYQSRWEGTVTLVP